MARPETIDKIAAAIQEITCGKKPPEPGESLRDYGVDSLDTVEVAMEVESLFGIEIDDADFENANTVLEIAALVERLTENVAA